MKKGIITSTLAIVSMVATSHAAVITLGSGNNDNVGGLANVVDGDHFRYDSGMGFTTATGPQSTVFTVQEAGNSVTLRMHWENTGTVTYSNGVAFLNSGDSITISFDLVSGSLDALSLNAYRLRAVTTGTDGSAGEGFTLTDNDSNANTWYSVRASNYNPELIGAGANINTFTSDSTYTGGNPVDPAVDPDGGLNVLSESNLDWSWTLAGVDPGVGGGTTNFALNQMTLEITPSAVPEPSSAALLGLAGLALILRRRK